MTFSDAALDMIVRGLFVVPLLIAAGTDLVSFRIPNWLSVVLVALFPVAQMVAPQPVDWVHHVLTAGLVLALGLVVFGAGMLGGGDVKLLTASALWLGPQMMPTWLMLIALTGGILALILLLVRSVPLPLRILLIDAKGQVPYALAIASAGIILSGQLPMLGH